MTVEEKLLNNPYFQPSVATKTLWLKTRKKTKEYGDNKIFPGFFITDENLHLYDTVAFGLALFFEVLGGLAIFLSSSDKYLIPKLIGIFLVIAFDYILAKFARRHDDKIALEKNRIKIAEFEMFLATNGIDQNKANDKIDESNAIIRKYKQQSYFFLVGLMISCGLKMVLFFAGIKGDFIFTKYEFLYATPFIYVAVMLLHWFFSTYWFNTNTFFTQFEEELAEHKADLKKIYKEIEDKTESEQQHLFNQKIQKITLKAKEIEKPIDLNTKIQTSLGITELKEKNIDNKHIITEENGGAQKLTTGGEIIGSIKYSFKTIGVLTDNDLHRLAVQDSSEQSWLVGIEGVKRQIQQLSQE